MKLLVLALSAAAALAVPGAGRSDASQATGVTLHVRNSAYGKILFDGRGYVLYAFSRDARGGATAPGDAQRAGPCTSPRAPSAPARA